MLPNSNKWSFSDIQNSPLSLTTNLDPLPYEALNNGSGDTIAEMLRAEAAALNNALYANSQVYDNIRKLVV